MRILIDLQGAQTESKYRGIGRYSLALTLAIIKNPRQHEICLLLNSSFPANVIEIREMFAEFIPSEQIHVLDTIKNVAELHFENSERARAAEKIREFFIQGLKPDIILLTSLFEGYLDDAVTSISSSKDGIKTAVILYDLIPLLNQTVYLTTPGQKAYYFNKINSLKNAGLLLAISEYSRKSGIEHLGFPPNNIINISTAVNHYFKPMSISSEEQKNLKKKFDLGEKFILCVTGGFDPRKNIKNLIIAYSQIPTKLKKEYKLVIASKIDDHHHNLIKKICSDSKLSLNQIVITNYVSNEELIQLYNLTDLFIFPSLQEGFGLPLLEAMSCGAPVLGSNTTSIPEVIGIEDALFDPHSPSSIASKIEQALTDASFNQKLRKQSLQQAQSFSWEKTANTVLDALENHFSLIKEKNNTDIKKIRERKPKLAFLSPFPPQRTGIADYSVQLLPTLSKHFDIELISLEKQVQLPPYLETIPKRSLEWFTEHATSYDRILYQFGNSPFHTHMLDLLDKYPGVVVLHDFFTSSLLTYEEIFGNRPEIWTKALLFSHGYPALQYRFTKDNIENTKSLYPCNLDILQKAKGIIVHSDYSKKLANKWYGDHASDNWYKIPLVRAQHRKNTREEARHLLNISPDVFLVCSFGHIDPSKYNDRIVNAWLKSQLFQNANCQLIFAGDNHGGLYGSQLVDCIKNTNIHIAGWCDNLTYRLYLEAADLAIQLRTNSRGETSAAVLDCMSYGLATIINANGSLAELPCECVYMLNDDFSDDELTTAIETLYKDNQIRQQLGIHANKYINHTHNPQHCADEYAEVLENIYDENRQNENSIIQAIYHSYSTIPTINDLKEIAQSINQSLVQRPRLKQILFDISNVIKHDLKSGIQRVVRAQLLELIKNQPLGYIIEPIYLSNDNNIWHYKYARQYTLSLLNISSQINIEDTPIDVFAGDIFYGADFACYEVMQAYEAGLFTRWRTLGVQINTLIYDLLPILHPEFFPPGADATHTKWLKTILAISDRVIGISHNVANELRAWLEQHPSSRTSPLKVTAAPLGGDIFASAPTLGFPSSYTKTINHFKQHKTFLMVGTIEPRKGYLQVLNAFDQLWNENQDYILVIVGKEGWVPVPEKDRRTIPKIVNKIQNHPELNKRLFWLNEVSDEYLEEIYKSSTCLIAATEGEGFGLPLIEAAKYHLPIIARDLPVFRELANENVHYFSGLTPNELSISIKNWVELHKHGTEPKSDNIKWLSWDQNAKHVLSILLGKEKERIWAPPIVRKKALDEHLHLIHKARINMVSTLLPPATYILDLGGANSPLYKMGYSYPFEKLTLIDLPKDERHEYYKEITIDSDCSQGNVVVRYSDMTTLQDIENESIDFVWSGQSIEHVPLEAGERMCREIFRVLKKGGSFCLDTPNRYLTQIHTRSIGGGFIHPEHYIEYLPEQLMKILSDAGFIIKKALGICDMPETVATNEFHYSDFMFGRNITEEVCNGYIQFFHCIKG